MPQSIENLVSILNNKHHKLGKDAALSLRKLGGEDAAHALLTALCDSKIWLRKRAEDALASHFLVYLTLEQQESFAAFVDYFVSKLADDDLYVKTAVAHVLAGWWNTAEITHWQGIEDNARYIPTNFDLILKALDDPDPVVRRDVVKAFTYLGDRNRLSVLFHKVNDPDIDVQAMAIWSLSYIIRFDDKDYPIEIIKTFLKALKHTNAKIRVAAVQAIKRNSNRLEKYILEDETILPVLLAAANDDVSEVCQAIAETLGRLKSTEAIPVLVDLLKAPIVTIRAAAIRSLGEIGNTDTVAYLVPLLDDIELITPLKRRTRRISDVTASALRLIGTPEAVNAVADWQSKAQINQ